MENKKIMHLISKENRNTLKSTISSGEDGKDIESNLPAVSLVQSMRVTGSNFGTTGMSFT